MSLEDIERFDYADLADGVSPRLEKEKREPPPKNPDQAGGRNNYFASRAGKMRRDGFDSEAILAAIRSENASKGYELPDRELVTIAKSIGGYEVADATNPGGLDENVRKGFVNHGVRVDAVGRLRNLTNGALARGITPGFLGDLIWNDLRKLGRVSAEDINRIIGIEMRASAEAEREKIAGRILNKPESAEALEQVRRFVWAITGRANTAVIGGFLQFMWCVKRSLAGLTREHDTMPILYNQIQGNGKSTAVRRLVSPMAELVDSITVETLADERKRADLGRFVIGVWDEMEGADKRDTDAIKNALSSQEVSYRPMRTNDNVSIVRTMNFIGTSNKPLSAMVRDSSGNRRFVEVETLPVLDHRIINEIDYPLLWQAISEHASAPAKAILVDIRDHQAIGRFEDSVILWMDEEDWRKYGATAISSDIRASYVAWCERQGENPLPVAMFNNRLVAEGFKRIRLRKGDETRPRAFAIPDARQGRTGPGPGPDQVDIWSPVHHKVPLSTEVIYMDQMDQSISMYKGKQPFPLMGNSPDQPGPVGPPVQAWPTPPRPGRELWVYDCEVFPNRFMFSAYNGSKWVEYDESTLDALAMWVRGSDKVLAGFNSHAYDDILVAAIATKSGIRTAADIYALSCRLIDPKTDADKEANFRARYGRRAWAYSVDVFQLLNGKGALKEWECRIGFPTIAESPAAFDAPLSDDLVPAVREYCRNDVLATAKLLTDRWHLVLLRETLAAQFDLGTRAYCLSEQGLAQATFLTLHRARTGENSNAVREKAAKAPENQDEFIPLAGVISYRVRFVTPEFNAVLEKLRRGDLRRGESWGITVDNVAFDKTVQLAGCELSIMVGGLHTVDHPGTFVADAETAIVDLDVTSYYPSLMLAERVYPSQLGPEFLADFTTIRDQRVAAKKAGDMNTSEALKIVLNATFGKLNDTWSPIRSVKNAFRVTMNGQLFLMMLIESLAANGFKILSANTDGIMILAPRLRLPELAGVTTPWEKATGLTLERTDYARIVRRDVNAYVALAESGKVKTKGPFNADAGKGDGRIIREAAIAYLLHGTDPAKTVGDATDPVAFLFYQRAKNGGDLFHGETPLGKTARWYASTLGLAIRRKDKDGSHHTIPNAHKATMALDITGWTVPTMPDLDRDFYVSAAWDLIRDSGA